MEEINKVQKLEWKDEYSLGVHDIDEQHKRIIGFIGRLADLYNSGGKIKDIEVILDEMTDYAYVHFGFEEKYFNEFHYVDNERHTAEHNEYRFKVDVFKKRLKKIESEGSDLMFFIKELFAFINDWWIWHIMHNDRKYVECFHEHGLK